MTLPTDTRPDCLRLLVLTPEYADYLWFSAMLADDSEIETVSEDSSSRNKKILIRLK